MKAVSSSGDTEAALSAEKWPLIDRSTAYLIVLHWMQPELQRELSARPSRFVLWDDSQPGPPQGAGVWQGFGHYVHELGTLSRGMPIWLTAYNCANINTPSDWLHTQEAFALVRRLSEEQWGTEPRKFLASLFTYTKSSFRLSECKWTSGWAPSHHRLLWTQPKSVSGAAQAWPAADGACEGDPGRVL